MVSTWGHFTGSGPPSSRIRETESYGQFPRSLTTQNRAFQHSVDPQLKKKLKCSTIEEDETLKHFLKALNFTKLCDSPIVEWSRIASDN